MAPSTMMPSVKLLIGLGGERQTKEFKDLLSTLPREEWMNILDLYQYQGFWLNAQLLQGVLSCQSLFKAEPTDLFLASIPKSGATWLKAMAFATINRARFPSPQHPLLVKNPHDLVPFVELAYSNNQVPDFTGFDSPRLFASHLPYALLPESITGSKSKIVYLARNPKDTLISLWCYTNKLRPSFIKPHPLEEEFESFCKGLSIFGPFWDHVLGYWKQSLENPEMILFLKYEDMKRDPKVHLRKLGEFLGCPFSLEEEKEGVLDGIISLCSFDNLRNLKVNKKGKLSSGFKNNAFFRRGEVGDWANHLTPEMGERLDRITEEKLHGSGLKF